MKEAQHQQIIVKHLKARCASDATWWASPNGMATNPITKRNMKPQGLRNGVPDLCFVKAGKPLYIELKTDFRDGRASVISDDQVSMHREIINAGGRVAVCFGSDEAIKQLEDWEVLRGEG